MEIPELKDFKRAPAIAEEARRTSFRQHRLKMLLTLYKGEFEDGSNAVMISDHAMACKVEKLGPPDFGKASAEIYGLPIEVMEKLSTLNMRPMYVKRNYLNIYAGDDVEGYSQIFAGTITSAAADFNTAPNLKLKIDARLGFYGSVTAQGQNVVSGTQPVSSFIEKQVKAAGLAFKNEGVSATVRNAVFSGSPIAQARQAAAQVGAELVIDDGEAVLIPSGAARKGNVPVLSAQTGLLGYPVMTSNGIEIRAVFNPDFRFAGLVELKSAVPRVSGQWRIIKLSHSLSSGMGSSGQWMSQMTAYYPQLSGATGRFA